MVPHKIKYPMRHLFMCPSSTSYKMQSSAPLLLDGINACVAAAISSKHCAAECLQADDVTILAACIQLNDDCVAICLLTMNALVSNSAFIKDICGLCATICEACAIECEKYVHMAHCTACALQCRQCALQCSKITYHYSF
jgi:hypothetical protein